MFQRIHDWRHERYIARLAIRCEMAYARGDRLMVRLWWSLMVAAIKARSVGQVRRMESRMDYVRRSIKRRLMDAFLGGRIPSTFVTAAFRLLRLRSL